MATTESIQDRLVMWFGEVNETPAIQDPTVGFG